MQEVLGACVTNLGEAAQLSSIAMAANRFRPFSLSRNSITPQDHADVRSADAPDGVSPARRLRERLRAYPRRITGIQGFDAAFSAHAATGSPSVRGDKMKNGFRGRVDMAPAKACTMQVHAFS